MKRKNEKKVMLFRNLLIHTLLIVTMPRNCQGKGRQTAGCWSCKLETTEGYDQPFAYYCSLSKDIHSSMEMNMLQMIKKENVV